jgi:hypothetical protein
MIAASAMMLAANLKTSPTKPEMSSTKIAKEKDPGLRDHSPIHESRPNADNY